jgi:predicted DsbA family dithiol-disulfide isomerase
MRARFEQQGLVYDPPDAIPNSKLALRVTERARDRGLHEAVHDRLMTAYWSEAQDIGDRDVLRRLAVEAGLDAESVDEVLAGDAYADRIEASTQEAHSIGINGIPAFLLGNRLLVLGAQPREVFEQALAQLG